jgi:DNA-binding transcriptional regulator YiaG
MKTGGRCANSTAHGIVCIVNELRDLRRAAGLSQDGFAKLLGVPYNTFRMWDNGLRAAPARTLKRAREILIERGHREEWLTLDQLAGELGVHERTLRTAARKGHLRVQFLSRSAFGRPIRRATRAAGETFMRMYYRHFEGHGPATTPLPVVPLDYDMRLRQLRRQLHLSQADLAVKIGAAGKAVVYQWESRKRAPTPVLWQRGLGLQGRRAQHSS